jgi:hypothetical protein
LTPHDSPISTLMTPSLVFLSEISLIRLLRSSRLPARCRRDLHPPGCPPGTLFRTLSCQMPRMRCLPQHRMPQARSSVPGDHEPPHPTGRGSAEPRLGNRTATAIIAIR